MRGTSPLHRGPDDCHTRPTADRRILPIRAACTRAGCDTVPSDTTRRHVRCRYGYPGVSPPGPRQVRTAVKRGHRFHRSGRPRSCGQTPPRKLSNAATASIDPGKAAASDRPRWLSPLHSEERPPGSVGARRRCAPTSQLHRFRLPLDNRFTQPLQVGQGLKRLTLVCQTGIHRHQWPPTAQGWASPS